MTRDFVLPCTENHNKTVEQITYPPFVLPRLPTLRRILNPRVGDKLLDSDSRFQQEILLGSKLVHQSNDNYLLLGPDVFYKKNVRRELPVEPACDVDSGQGTGVMWKRGMRRWTALPDVVEVCLSLCIYVHTTHTHIHSVFV